MEKINKEFFNKNFLNKVIQVRKLEAQRHHQNDMYAKPLQNKRKKRVENEIKKYCVGKSFYDIGCAEGLFCDLAISFGAKIAKGVDVVEEKIKKAKLEFSRCEFDVVDCLNLQEKKSYDVVLCSEVLQHIVDYKKCLSEIVKILNEDGIFILTTPNLSPKNSHLFADLKPTQSSDELLHEIGGASFGKQNAIWKFNTQTLYKDIGKEFSLRTIDYFKIGAKPINDQTKEQASNLFTVMVFQK